MENIYFKRDSEIDTSKLNTVIDEDTKKEDLIVIGNSMTEYFIG